MGLFRIIKFKCINWIFRILVFCLLIEILVYKDNSVILSLHLKPFSIKFTDLHRGKIVLIPTYQRFLSLPCFISERYVRIRLIH